MEINRTFATRAMKVSSELSSNYATSHNLGMQALYEIVTMPESERDKPQQLPSGEVKKPDEMTVRETNVEMFLHLVMLFKRCDVTPLFGLLS